MARHEPLSALLVISAIDLLLASLVCAVVLFVALVGTRGQTNDEKSDNGSRAPIPITLLYRSNSISSSGRPDVINALRLGDPQAANAEDAEHSGFKFSHNTYRSLNSLSLRELLSLEPRTLKEYYHWLSFTVNSGAKEVTIAEIPTVAYAAIHLGTAGSFYLWMRCREPGWRLRLALDTFRVIEDTCKNRQDVQNERPTEMPPKPFLIVSNRAPPSTDWDVIFHLPDGTGMVSRWAGKSTSVPIDVSTAIFTY